MRGACFSAHRFFVVIETQAQKPPLKTYNTDFCGEKYLREFLISAIVFLNNGK
jgi:hypothetical protein